jgi:hypothetical protein
VDRECLSWKKLSEQGEETGNTGGGEGRESKISVTVQCREMRRTPANKSSS